MTEIKAPGYDIPVKELDLGGGAIKILPGAAAPDVSAPEGEYLSVCLFGRGVRAGDVFRAPVISYEKLKALFDGAPKKSYSAKDAVFGYRGETGRFLPLERVINELYDGGFSLADTAKASPEAVLTVSSGTRSVRVALGQLAEGERYYFPLLTSEQILAGLKPADAKGEQLNAGLLLTESGKIVFVLGQLGWNDIVEPCFVEFAAGGALIKLSKLTAERTKHNVLFTGPPFWPCRRRASSLPGRTHCSSSFPNRRCNPSRRLLIHLPGDGARPAARDASCPPAHAGRAVF